jgi:hypothetical protein
MIVARGRSRRGREGGRRATISESFGTIHIRFTEDGLGRVLLNDGCGGFGWILEGGGDGLDGV